jgi:branched-chain amino acid transport system permease protein
MQQLLQIIVIGVPIGLAYSAVALGFNVTYRAGRVFNVALGEMFALAVFFEMWLMGKGWSAWAAFGATTVGMVAVSLLIQRVLLQPLLGQSVMSLFMMTLGVLLLINGLSNLCLGVPTGVFPELFGDGRIKLPYDVAVPVSRIIGVLILLALVLILTVFFERTQLGLSMTAVAEDHEVAQSLGISIRRSLALSWAVAGLLIPIAAEVYLSGVNVSGDVSSVAFLALPVVLLGGLESIGGVALGGIVVGAAQTAASIWLDPKWDGGASLVLPYGLMLLILLVKPEGLFGWRRVERA